MSLLNCNGFPITHGEIKLPRVGIGTASLTLDSEQDFEGQAVISSDDLAFILTGFAFRHGQFVNKQQLRWVAGNGGFDTIVQPKEYLGWTIKNIAGDILSSVGESLSSTSDATLTQQYQAVWIRLGQQTAKSALQAILDAKGAQAWRVLADGTTWLAQQEPWPAISSSLEYEVIRWEREEGWADIGCVQPFLLPGTTMQMDDGSGNMTTQRVSYVVHTIEPTRIRTKAYFEDGGPI